MAAAPQAGAVLALFGQCFVESGGRRTPLQLGDAVRVGDAVDVAAGAKLKLRMINGSGDRPRRRQSPDDRRLPGR